MITTSGKRFDGDWEACAREWEDHSQEDQEKKEYQRKTGEELTMAEYHNRISTPPDLSPSHLKMRESAINGAMAIRDNILAQISGISKHLYTYPDDARIYAPHLASLQILLKRSEHHLKRVKNL